MITGVGELYHMKHSNPAKALDTACKEFESMFAYQLLKVMGQSIPEGGLFEKGLATDMYKDMLFQNIGQTVAESGALGIGRTLKQHMQHKGAVYGDSGTIKQNR